MVILSDLISSLNHTTNVALPNTHQWAQSPPEKLHETLKTIW